MTENVTDEMLMAYVDGELDPDAQENLRNLVARNPELAARVDVFTASHRIARAAFEPELAQPVPARLINAILAAAEAKPDNKIVRFPTRRMMKTALPMAASIAVAFAVGGYWFAQRNLPSNEILGMSPLALALAQTPGGERTPLATGGELSTVGSYRTVNGFCRVFEVSGMRSGAGMRGVGCARGTSGWSIDLAVATGSDGIYTPASAGLLESIDAYLDALEAEPLAAEEDALIRK